MSATTAYKFKKDYLEQAKQMEKEQILNAFTDGDYQAFESEAEQYYNETYGK